jgi:uncharacterized protein (TIGR03437 family)
MGCRSLLSGHHTAVKTSLILLALTPLALAQADLRGIYIYTNDVSQISSATATALTKSLSIPGVDGVAVEIGWDAIEPSMGQYQWATLDQWLSRIIALGLKIDLVVPAGSATPAWLFQAPPNGAGATELQFTVSPHSGETGVCDTDNIAAPWDPVFLAQWDAMLSALSAHLKAANEYNAITLLRLTGINRTSEELRLPAETAASTGLACVSNSIAIWMQAGYRPSLLLQGWNAVVTSFNKYFPDKSFSVSIITNNAFPGINQNGTLISGPIGDENEPLLQSASQMLPGRLVVQVDFLMPGEQASVLVTNAEQNYGTLAAYQTNEYLGGSGAACSEPVTNPTPCTAATFTQLLDTGIYPLGQSSAVRSQYIEVFHDNAAAFPADILQAHFELLPPAITKVANAEGEAPVIAPNTWVEIKGSGLSLTGDSRTWATADFVKNQLPTALDSVSATVNNKPAYVYYISPGQIDILTPPDAMSGSVPVVVANNGTPTASFTVEAQPLSPSFFVFNGGPYVAATHVNGAYLGPPTLYSGLTTPAKAGEVVVIYANGFGPTSTPLVSGATTQSGSLSPLPVIKIGGIAATVQFAGLVAPGQYQFNVAIPANVPSGDQSIVATYNGQSTQSGTLITIQ